MAENLLIMDLDGTLLFAEERPGALMVPGRRRHSYMAGETVEMLAQMQRQCKLVLATGRSRLSVLYILDGLRQRGVEIYLTVAENGGIWINEEFESQCFVSPGWIEQVKIIEASMPQLVQTEFESCVALLNPQAADLAELDRLTNNLQLQHRRLQDGNKLFILAEEVDKKHTLERVLGVEALSSAWGIGNDFNDVDWIKEVGISAAPACAREELLQAVRQNRGYISGKRGHDGIADILDELQRQFICIH